MLTSRVKVIDGWITVKSKNSEEGEREKKGYRRILLGPGGKIKGGDVPKEVQGKKIGSKEAKETLKKVSEKTEQKESKPIKRLSEGKAEPVKEVSTEQTEKKEQKIEKPKTASEIREHFISVLDEKNKKVTLLIKESKEWYEKIQKIQKEYREKYPELSFKERNEKIDQDSEYIKGLQLEKERQKKKDELKISARDFLFNLLELPENNRAKIQTHTNSDFDKKVKTKVDKMLEGLGKIVHSKINPHADIVPLGLAKGYPGERDKYSNGNIVLNNVKEGVVFHEFGHHLEHIDLKIKNKCAQFLFSRTKNERSIPLSKINSAYSLDEKCKKDHFLDAYVGKIYSNRVTEVLSMGLQFLVQNPTGFAKKDPEHFDFVVKILRGEK